MYLEYEEYQEMGGTLDVTTFNLLEFEAESLVNWYTFDRLKNTDTTIYQYPPELSRCMYALIERLKLKMDAMTVQPSSSESGGGSTAAITHQSNDGVSISYNVVSASQAVSLSKAECGEIISRSLQGVKDALGHKLLYRGIYPDE